MTLSVQMMTMAAMIVGGIYVGFALETYRRLIRSYKKWPLLLYVLESVFWVSQTAILFFVLYEVNQGEVRMYAFLACLLGYSIYQVVCKRVYQKVLESGISALKIVVGGIVKMLNTLVLQPVLWLCSFLIKLIKYVCKLIWILLYYPLKLIFFIGKKIVPVKIYKNISNFYVFCSTIVYKLSKKMQHAMKKWR